MTATNKLALELLAAAAANQTLANTTFAQLNQLVMAGVVDKDLSTPPGSPANEALYIVAASATGDWDTKDGQLAYWLDSTSAWHFIVPISGFRVSVLDELDANGVAKVYAYTGSAWALPEGGGGGVSLPAVQTFAGNKTLALADINTYNVSQDGSAQSVTVPPQSSVTWTADAEIHFERGGAGALTFVAGAGVTINHVATAVLSIGARYGVATLKRTAEDAWTLFGALELA